MLLTTALLCVLTMHPQVDCTAKLWHVRMGRVGFPSSTAAHQDTSNAASSTPVKGTARAGGSVWGQPSLTSVAGAADLGSQQLESGKGGQAGEGWEEEWETEEHMACLAEYPHPDFVTCVAFHPGAARCFATGCADGRVRVWDVQEGAVLASAAVIHDMITALAWSLDGTQLAVGTLYGKCRCARLFVQTWCMGCSCAGW